MIQAEFPSKSEEMKSVRLFKVSAIWRHPKAKRLVQKDFLISASSGEDAKDIAQQHLPTDMRLRNTPVNTVITNNLKLHIFDYGRPDNLVTYYESPLMECTIGRTDNQPVRTVLEPMVKKVQNTPTQPSAQPKQTAPQTLPEPKPETLPKQETFKNQAEKPDTAVPENTTADTQADTDTTDHSVQQPPEQKSEPTSEENPETTKDTPENPEPETEETENEQTASEPNASENTEKSNDSGESNESDESDETEETGDTTQNLIWLNSLFLTRFSYEMGRMQNLPDVPGIFLTKMQTIVKHPAFWTDLPNIVGNWVMEAYEKDMPDEQTALQFLQEKINAFIDNEGKQYLHQKEGTPHEKETC